MVMDTSHYLPLGGGPYQSIEGYHPSKNRRVLQISYSISQGIFLSPDPVLFDDWYRIMANEGECSSVMVTNGHVGHLCVAIGDRTLVEIYCERMSRHLGCLVRIPTVFELSLLASNRFRVLESRHLLNPGWFEWVYDKVPLDPVLFNVDMDMLSQEIDLLVDPVISANENTNDAVCQFALKYEAIRWQCQGRPMPERSLLRLIADRRPAISFHHIQPEVMTFDAEALLSRIDHDEKIFMECGDKFMRPCPAMEWTMIQALMTTCERLGREKRRKFRQ